MDPFTWKLAWKKKSGNNNGTPGSSWTFGQLFYFTAGNYWSVVLIISNQQSVIFSKLIIVGIIHYDFGIICTLFGKSGECGFADSSFCNMIWWNCLLILNISMLCTSVIIIQIMKQSQSDRGQTAHMHDSSLNKHQEAIIFIHSWKYLQKSFQSTLHQYYSRTYRGHIWAKIRLTLSLQRPNYIRYLLSISVSAETVTKTTPRPHQFPCSICGLYTVWNLFLHPEKFNRSVHSGVIGSKSNLLHCSFLPFFLPDAIPGTFHKQCNLWKLFLKRDYKFFAVVVFVHFHPSPVLTSSCTKDCGGLSDLIPPVKSLFKTRVKINKPPSGLCRFVVETVQKDMKYKNFEWLWINTEQLFNCRIFSSIF